MEEKAIQFGLKSVRTDEFAIVEDVLIADDKIQLDHSIAFSLNHDATELMVQFKVNFKSQEQSFIILSINCVFGIKSEDLTISAHREPGKIRIPKGFMTHLASLTVGTARGVLHSKLEQTNFNKYLLPLLDMSKSFEKDAVFEAENQASQ